jgi:hypothetical protein
MAAADLDRYLRRQVGLVPTAITVGGASSNERRSTRLPGGITDVLGPRKAAGGR